MRSNAILFVAILVLQVCLVSSLLWNHGDGYPRFPGRYGDPRNRRGNRPVQPRPLEPFDDGDYADESDQAEQELIDVLRRIYERREPAQREVLGEGEGIYFG